MMEHHPSIAATLVAAALTTLVAAALIGLYFRAEVAAFVTQYADQQDIFRGSTIGGQVVGQETQLPSQASRKTDSLALQQQAEADQASAQAGAQEAGLVRQAAGAAAPEARQSLGNEQRPGGLANEPAEARRARAIDRLNLQLREGAANSAQLLGQERQDATAARQELTASAIYRHALEEERARSAALASELAMARRDVETQVALSSKRGDEAPQLKQAAESATAELRRSLQQEHDRAEALASEPPTPPPDTPTPPPPP